MTRRKNYIGGNWKMNLDHGESVDLAKALADELADDSVDVCIFPAFPYLHAVSAVLSAARSRIKLGGALVGGASLEAEHFLQIIGLARGARAG